MNNIEIMGVLNITENSFHDGGKYNSFKESFQNLLYLKVIASSISNFHFSSLMKLHKTISNPSIDVPDITPKTLCIILLFTDFQR